MALQVKVSSFEGPLDLLLQLVGQNKIRIEDIFLSNITEQYLETIRDIDMDMEAASEFLAVAATLLEIKSRSLLPKPPPPEEEDPQQALIRRLQDYRLFKEISQLLGQREEEASGAYYKLPEQLRFSDRLELENVSLSEMLAALEEACERFLRKAQPPSVREIKHDLYTVRDKIGYIRNRMTDAKRLPFRQLFENNASRAEVVVTFSALLELWKARYVHLVQPTLQADITLERR